MLKKVSLSFLAGSMAFSMAAAGHCANIMDSIGEIKENINVTKVGIGVASVPEYEGADKSEAAILPYVHVGWQSGRFLHLAGNRLSANLLSDQNWQAGPVLQYRSKRDDGVDSRAVSLMREVDSAVEAGAYVAYRIGQYDLSLQAVNDISGEHDGLLVTAAAGYTYKFADNLRTRLGVSTTYASDDYMDTYFSVDANNSLRSGLPQFNADSGLKDVGVNLVVQYDFSANWGVLGLVSYNKLLSDAKDSPVVDIEGDDNQYAVAIGVVYTF